MSNPLQELFVDLAAKMLRHLQPSGLHVRADAILMKGAVRNSAFDISVALRAGADVHAANEFALKRAAFAGNDAAVKALLQGYDVARDWATLAKIQTDAARFKYPKVQAAFAGALAHAGHG